MIDDTDLIGGEGVRGCGSGVVIKTNTSITKLHHLSPRTSWKCLFFCASKNSITGGMRACVRDQRT